MKKHAVVVAVTLLGSIVLFQTPAPAAPGTTRDPVAVCGKPNGCGSKDGIIGAVFGPKFVRDSYGNVSFTSSCAVHDNCYATPGKTQRQCDDEFRQDMYKACRSEAHNPACFSLADAYYKAVDLQGGGAYRTSQQCANEVTFENNVSDANALIALSEAEASTQGTKALQQVVGAGARRLVEAEAIAKTTNADYARIQALLLQVDPKPAASTCPTIVGPLGNQVKDPKCIEPGQKTVYDEARVAQINQMKTIEAQAKSFTDRVNKNLASGTSFQNSITTSAQTISPQSASQRGKAVRALATDAKGAIGNPFTRPAALTKIATARAQYGAFLADITQDITAQTSRSQTTIDAMIAPMAQNQSEVASLKLQAERVAAGTQPKPAPLAPIRPLVLPGQKR